MHFLIRFLTKNAAGGVESRDKALEGDAITIGRATDQTLHLKDRRARLEHARIEAKDGDVRITTASLAGVTVNGHSVREAKLDVGDTIEVGSNILTVIEPPQGVDFAITFELSGDASDEDLAADWSTPAAGIGGFGKRRLSWVLVAAVLGLALVLPAAGLLDTRVASAMRSMPLLPDDGIWLAGPLHSAHSTIGDDCEACHVQPFRRVPDEACTDCHTVPAHVDEEAHAVLGSMRCASCHLEHNEPPSLVRRHQRLCADCHEAPPEDIDILPASDFLDAHPGFRVSLETPADGGWTILRASLADAPPERSNLKFDHAAHLDPRGIVTPDGQRVLDCGECHAPMPGGARMQPLSMDEHCIDCHALTFDAEDPSRRVPHGDPEGVLQALVEYYSARLLGDDPAAATQRLRRPGQRLTREDRDRVAAEARTKAMAVAEDLFERRACANCHEVKRTDGELRWRVEPVKLTQAFFPNAAFSHSAHEPVAECGDCHDAATSATSSDLLMPGIDTCRDCHGSGIARRNASGKLASTCIVCHGFHEQGT